MKHELLLSPRKCLLGFFGDGAAGSMNRTDEKVMPARMMTQEHFVQQVRDYARRAAR